VLESAAEAIERGSSDQTAELWSAYRNSGDARLRDRLVLTLSPLVKHIVYHRIAEIPARRGVEDLISCGLAALMRALDEFDPASGAGLEQFAWTRIHGAVLEELRHDSWAPGSTRCWDRDMSAVGEQFAALYGRNPTTAEIRVALGLTPQPLQPALS
jgi:RNA polymerase sigma factor FliA